MLNYFHYNVEKKIMLPPKSSTYLEMASISQVHLHNVTFRNASHIYENIALELHICLKHFVNVTFRQRPIWLYDITPSDCAMAD